LVANNVSEYAKSQMNFTN